MPSPPSSRATEATADRTRWNEPSRAVAADAPAQRALADSPVVELRELEVHEQEDGLVISGRVQSFYHKQLAQETVRPHAGARRLVNHVRVEA